MRSDLIPLLTKTPISLVVCETEITTGLVLVMGKITMIAYVDTQKVVRETISEIGYAHAKYGFDCDICGGEHNDEQPISPWGGIQSLRILRKQNV